MKLKTSAFLLDRVILLGIVIFLSCIGLLHPLATDATVDVVTACHADIDQSGTVDLIDYSLLVQNFFKTPIAQPRADINQSGNVDITDYSLLVKFFFQKCSPTPTPMATNTPIVTVVPSIPSSSPIPTSIPGKFDHSVPKPLGFVPQHPVILDSYTYKGPVSTGNGTLVLNNIEDMVYKPRQYNKAPYIGWDWIQPSGDVKNGVFRTYTDSEWLTLKLHRATKVAVVWDGSKIPSWLSSWTPATAVGTRKVFVKNFPAGDAILGAIGGTENFGYDVLLAESDGSVSQIPETPVNQSVPTPNTTCPAWVHNEYATLAPDGKYYRTWHRAIDPNYWCYFNHEHGSNPKQFGDGSHLVPFGYVTNRSDHADPHEGFKIWSFKTRDRTLSKNYDVLFEVHFGTSRPERSCQRNHATSMYVADSDTKELLVKLTFVGDFGIPYKNGDIEDETTRVKCPNLPVSIHTETTGIKKARVYPDNQGYENWRLGTEKLILGVVSAGGLTFDTHAPITGHGSLNCTWTTPGDDSTISCGTPMITGQLGVGRFINYGDTFYFSASRAAKTGTFYTDEYGEVLRQPTDIDAVQQFIKPGVEIRLKATDKNETGQQTQIFTNEPWDMQFLVKNVLEFSQDYSYEKSIKSPN